MSCVMHDMVTGRVPWYVCKTPFTSHVAMLPSFIPPSVCYGKSEADRNDCAQMWGTLAPITLTPETAWLSGLMPLEIDLWMDDQWPLRYTQLTKQLLIGPYTKTIKNQEIYHGHHLGRFHPHPLSISSIIQHCCAIMTQGQDCKVDQSCLSRCTNWTQSQVPLNSNGPTSTIWSQRRNEESQLSIHRDFSR